MLGPLYGQLGPLTPRRRRPGFDPTSLPGLLRAFDDTGPVYQDAGLTTPAVADGDPVRVWVDRAGAGNATKSGTPPVLRVGAAGGRNAVRLTGSWLDFGPAAGVRYVCAVVRANAPGASQDNAPLVGNDSTYDFAGGLGDQLFSTDFSGAANWGATFDGLDLAALDLIKPLAWSVVEVVTSGPVPLRYFANDRNAYLWDADFAALYLAAAVPDGATRAALCASLLSRYGVTGAALPTLIVFDGNSLSYPAYGSFVPDVLGLFPGTQFSWRNPAFPGLATDSCTGRAPTLVDPAYRAARAHNVCVIWEITNDLYLHSGTASSAYNNLKTYCQGRTAVGFKVVAGTCLPRSVDGLYAGFEADRQAVNALVRSHAVAEGWAAAVADVGGDPTIGAFGASDDPTYYGDKTHLTAAGDTIAAPYFAAAIAAVT